MKYYVLIKRVGSSRFLGAIPSKAGVSKASLGAVLKKNLKKGFSARIVTDAQFRGLVRKGKSKVRSPVKRKIKRKVRG